MATAATLTPSGMGMRNDPEDIDGLPPALRDLVHEFGWSIVRAFLDLGIRKPAEIRHLVHTVHLGARESANRRAPGDNGSYRVLRQLDDFLLREGTPVTARALVGVLRRANCALLPREPTNGMADVALEARPSFGSTPHEAMIHRLRAAMLYAERELWPFLEPDSL